MSRFLPIALLLLQLVLLLVPAVSTTAAYVFMVVAPLLTAGATFWRARHESPVAKAGWSLLTLALVIWASGAFINLWEELILGHVGQMYRSTILAFSLATVPAVLLLAGDWRSSARRYTWIIDAALALTLGFSYFLLTWSLINDYSDPSAPGVTYVVWLLDAQNLYLTSGAAIRWCVAQDRPERDLFRSLTIYSLIYSLIVFANDHLIAGDPAYGPQLSSIITIAFAVLATFALSPTAKGSVRRASVKMENAVRSASPILLAAALLLVSLALIRINYVAGAAGVLVTVLGSGLRNTVRNVRHIEREDNLRRERSQLRVIAWTDALTGIPNRHYLDEALRKAERRERRAGVTLAILMIDIDLFKMLNDRYGHPAGDACLRDVAQLLQEALVRPDDILARYGGEEFVALLRDTDAKGARVVAERLRVVVEAAGIENLASPFKVVTVSIGVANAALSGSFGAMRLMELADKALYEAKSAGRNQVRHLEDTAPDHDV